MPDRRPAIPSGYPPFTKGDWIRGIRISVIGLFVIGAALYLLLSIPDCGGAGGGMAPGCS
jgi:hypothetical protein